MKKLTCIIIDDEPLARKGLVEYIQDVEFLELVGEFEHPLKAMEVLTKHKIDLIFLDIQMPKMTGLEFLKNLSEAPYVIFITAYPQHAVTGFELNAVDYLLKPFSFERFWKAVMKVNTLAGSSKRPESATSQLAEDHIFIKSDNKLIKIFYDDILFVEALQNYVAVHTATKKYITYLTIKTVEENLPEQMFLKIHKSYIVSLSKIDSIEGNEIRVGQHSLPISRTSKDEIMEKILAKRYLKR